MGKRNAIGKEGNGKLGNMPVTALFYSRPIHCNCLVTIERILTLAL